MSRQAVLEELDERQLLKALKAIRKGDFSARLPVDLEGITGEICETFNEVAETNERLRRELEKIRTTVGREGKTSERVSLGAVEGDWVKCADSVNSLIRDLVQPTTEISRVIGAVAKGDLSLTMAVEMDDRPLKGEFLRTAETINIMVDQLRSFASEVTRVAREVGTDGKLGGQAEVKGVAGTWKDLTDNVNWMAGNLAAQVRNIAEVTTAVANGNLSKKITVDVKGEILELKDTINTMVDQLNSFASEVTRVAREVGTEGKLGGQAQVKGVAGTWKDLTDNVNSMASGLTAQVRDIAKVATAVANGDLSQKITVDVKGEILELKQTVNRMVDNLNTFSGEVTRVAREVGTEGKLGGQAQVGGVAGTWKDLTDNVNSMANNLTAQVRNIAEVTTAVATGDLSKKITVDVKGEILELKNTINTMVDQLRSFASEVTRVAREVGSEGKLGGQAEVKGAAGTWKDLTDNVNSMASNLTSQVRGIARVVTSVANGDLKRKLALEARGEIAALADTINEMIDTLATFADQVTTVAREVGIEGKLGGQARVPGAAGTWRDLTDNVNQLAANLTTQVRAIAEVATAVTKGDLTRSIAVKAQGEVAQLKDNINQMIANLRETTQKNTEQDWLKTNLAKFTRMLQGQRDLETVSRKILSELAPLVSAQHGIFYLAEAEDEQPVLKLLSSYAYRERKNLASRFKQGEGLVGQCVLEKERILVSDVPEDYIKITSGLGEGIPLNIIVLPVLYEGQVKAVIELASFRRFSETHQAFLDQLTESIGIVLNTIEATTRTEELLKQSQSLAEELQVQQKELTATNKRLEEQANSLQASEDLLRQQQEELQQSNEELEEKARLLSIQNTEVERKNREVGQAKKILEEKADQLALSSRYKSEFLANMSHELRTPLNSIMILSRLLSENGEKTLNEKQVEHAHTIYSSGSDLLALIDDILDLSKIESGVVTLELEQVSFADLADYVDRNFRQLAEHKGLDFAVKIKPGRQQSLYTDSKRVKQVLKNFLSNAFKFTEKGRVTLEVHEASVGWSADHPVLCRADTVIALSVTDTGIGIPEEKQKLIFEAFQQADGTTSRKYGGTGLGLAISREIAQLLGGEIRMASKPGEGSSFTLYIPRYYRAPSETVQEPKTKGAVVVPEAPTAAGALPSLHRDLQSTQVPVPAAPAAGTRQIKTGPSEGKEKVIYELSGSDPILTGKRILVVDDDVRNIFALTSVLEQHKMIVLDAENGRECLDLLEKDPDIDLVLMDIMMPEMDGYVTMRAIRKMERYHSLPIIALTAKAMKGDREKCIVAGASDYIAKPLDTDQLLSLLRVWLYR